MEFWEPRCLSHTLGSSQVIGLGAASALGLQTLPERGWGASTVENNLRSGVEPAPLPHGLGPQGTLQLSSYFRGGQGEGLGSHWIPSCRARAVLALLRVLFRLVCDFPFRVDSSQGAG